ncbi:MAG: methylenetetrahydrofolate reductase [NAD(P)H] [Solirubrobacterales bacterium]|nr:methylenetetrahydrofolate reductase [NAD(P)H] [Solirubrobacterales bacterium]
MRIDEILTAKGEPVFSFEFFPPRTPEGVENLWKAVEVLRGLEPDFVSVTYGAGGATRDGTLEISSRLKNELGVETMAHLSCVGETAEGIEEMLRRIEAAGIENVLALRGDPPKGESEFIRAEGGYSSATELARLASERFDFSLGGSCFPEVHPEAASAEADLDYLKTKVDAGARFLITQLFFDNRVYFEFVAAARGAGIDVPIIPGVIPIGSFGQVRRICALCDATIPDELEAAMAALGGDPEAEAMLGIAYAARQCDELLARGAPGIHFYALNRAPGTRAVLSALRAARPWELGRGAAIEEARA